MAPEVSLAEVTSLRAGVSASVNLAFVQRNSVSDFAGRSAGDQEFGHNVQFSILLELDTTRDENNERPREPCLRQFTSTIPSDSHRHDRTHGSRLQSVVCRNSGGTQIWVSDVLSYAPRLFGTARIIDYRRVALLSQ